MKSSFALALLLLVSACAGSKPPPIRVTHGAPPDAGMVLMPGYAYPAHDTVRVVTWNVEHFVDAHDDPYVDNDREDAPPATLADRRRLFAEAVRRLDADVVVLQEFESAAYLEAVARDDFPEMGYRFFAGTESPSWYQNVVVMSRLPLGVVRSYVNVVTPVEGETDEQGRPEAQSLTNNRMWLADVLARPGYTFTLAGLHLKAGQGPRNEGWRRGQIRFLHEQFAQLLALYPAANLLVAGDLNAVPESNEFRLLLNPRGPAVFIDPLAATPTPTHPSEAPIRQLDHLLPNTHMLPELVPGSMRVAVPLPVPDMARISDHLPVVGAFLAREG